MKFPSIFALSLAFALSALAQGPGGSGGFNPGGGNTPGGGAASGAFNYDSIASDTTNSDHTVFRTDGGLLYRYASAPASIAPPAAVTAIADGLFAGCATLVTADLSATTITDLPSDCFAECTALTTVKLPATCTAIGPNAFAGCSTLASVTAPGVTTIAPDAFRGCAALTALPAAATALGDYAFAQSGLTAVDADGLTLAPGAFAGCESLATLQNAPSALPDALCAGCTALDFPDLAGKTLGAAALAGIPTTAFTVSSATTFGDSSLAADSAPLAADSAPLDTVFDLADDALPAYADTAFLGRSVGFTPSGTSDTAPLGAFHLVTWLQDQAAAEPPLAEPPAAYDTDALESWLKTPGNPETYAYASQIETNSSRAILTFSDDHLGFVVATPDPGLSVTATPVACYSLTDGEWLATNLLQDPDTGIYYPAEDTTACFATLRFAWDW